MPMVNGTVVVRIECSKPDAADDLDEIQALYAVNRGSNGADAGLVRTGV